MLKKGVALFNIGIDFYLVMDLFIHFWHYDVSLLKAFFMGVMFIAALPTFIVEFCDDDEDEYD